MQQYTAALARLCNKEKQLLNQSSADGISLSRTSIPQQVNIIIIRSFNLNRVSILGGYYPIIQKHQQRPISEGRNKIIARSFHATNGAANKQQQRRMYTDKIGLHCLLDC